MLGVSLCICLRQDMYIGDRLSDTHGHSDFNLELLCPFDGASLCASVTIFQSSIAERVLRTSI